MEQTFFPAFARFAHDLLTGPIPEVGKSRARDAITDCVGCIAAGSKEELAPILQKSLQHYGRKTSEAIVADGGSLAAMAFTSRMAQPAEAALFNGALAHALDFDDSSHPAYAHPSAVLVPTLLAASKLAPCSGQTAIAAYIIGLEMFSKLARGMNNRHYELGWHATSTFGTVAAAAATAAVMRLPAAQFADALRLSTTFASGLRVHFGTMTKPLHAGMAARSGILAASLAREFFGCSAEALEHQYGYASVFNGGEGTYSLEAMMPPGEPLEIMTAYGVSLKAFPSCGATHPGIEAATLLHPWLKGRAVRKIRIGVPELSFKPLIHHNPKTALQGKFSLEFCVAAGLTDGAVRISTFTDERVNASDIVSLISRTEMVVDERVRHEAEWSTAVRVETEDGDTKEELVPLAIGKTARWFSEEVLRNKFMDCSAGALDQALAAQLFDALRRLDTLPDISELEQKMLRPD